MVRLWEVVGVNPLDNIMVIYNPAVRKYKDVLIGSGAILDHPSGDIEYIYPEKHIESTIQKKVEPHEEETRLIREE